MNKSSDDENICSWRMISLYTKISQDNIRRHIAFRGFPRPSFGKSGNNHHTCYWKKSTVDHWMKVNGYTI